MAQQQRTSPIILAKSCHDTDILRWLINEPAQYVPMLWRSFMVQRSNAPEGSTARCTDGCAVEAECPFSAIQIYLRDRKRLYVFDLPEDTGKWNKIILRNLFNTNYGRCVYRMDNDQPDHLTVNMQFDKNITASFSMEAFTSYEGRVTRVMARKEILLATWKPILLLILKVAGKQAGVSNRLSWRRRSSFNAGLGAGCWSPKPANTFFYN